VVSRPSVIFCGVEALPTWLLVAQLVPALSAEERMERTMAMRDRSSWEAGQAVNPFLKCLCPFQTPKCPRPWQINCLPE